jgi:hypothetical protein
MGDYGTQKSRHDPRAAEMDLSQTFEKGQGYVALSRLKSLDGLRLLGINDMALQLDSLAFKADQRFLELSHKPSNNGQTVMPKPCMSNLFNAVVAR